MGRAIPPEARVRLQSAPPETLRKGDVAVYARGGRLVGHRVVTRWRTGGARWFLVKGDALRFPDRPIREDRVIARVVSVETAGRVAGPVPRSRNTGLLVWGFVLAWRVRQWLGGGALM